MGNRFYYKDDEVNAKNMDGAFTKFLDDAWGIKWVDFLKEEGRPFDFDGAIGCVEVKDEEKSNLGEYWQDVEKFANGDTIKFQLWDNLNGTYTGEATQLT